MDIKGYYKTLGITDEERNLPKDQFNELCKKKYRALCLKWHPDRWATASEEEKKKAEDEFKKVAEAYDTLGDEEKKHQYDSGFGGGGDDAGGFDPMMDWLRRSGFNFGGGFGHQQRPSGHPGEDVHAYVTLTFAESLTMNMMKDVTVKKRVACPDCNGTGSEDGQKHDCPYCHGTGVETQTQRYGNSFTMSQRPCSHCHGTGKQIDHPCKKCGGTGFVEKEETMKLSIPGAVRNGMTIVYSQMGGEGDPGWQNGDLLLHVSVKEEVPGYFVAHDNDINIYHTEKVNFVDALLGTKVTVKCPNGKDWTFNLRECTQPGEKFTKSGGGYPGNNRFLPSTGDYVVFIEYDVPSKLTKAQRKALEEYKKEK